LLAGGALYFVKHRAAMKALESAKDDSATLQHLYDDARRELVAGKYDSARNTFTRLAGEAQNKQPLLNWIRLHRGLAALLRGYTTQARQAFEELEKAGPFSAKAEDAALARFFVETAHTMISPDPVPAGATGVPDPKSPQTFRIFLFAIKDWQQSDFTNAGILLEQFVASESAGNFAWINDYKPLAQKYLADYRVYADWKKQQQQLDGAEHVNAALDRLRAAQSKLQLSGKLKETFKEEEAKLSQQLAERQKK
jgi:hypothetical protein